MHKLSVVIPVLNGERFIIEALHSARNQKGAEVEIIVVDGGSTDNTLEIVEKSGYADLVITGPDSGQSEALNKGFARADGDICYWLNADDLMAPGALSTVLDLFDDNPHCTIVYGGWDLIDSEGDTVFSYLPLPPSRPVSVRSPMQVYNQSLFWSRAVHEYVLPFDERLHLLMDVDMIIRLLLSVPHTAFAGVPQSLGAFRIRTGQKTGSRFSHNRMKEERIIEERYHLPALLSPTGALLRTASRVREISAMIHAGGVQYALSVMKRKWSGI